MPETKGAPDTSAREVVSWHALAIDECISKLGLDEGHFKGGLSSAEADRRLKEYGPNKLTEKRKKTLLERIWAQVANVLVLILVIVALVSLIRAITAATNPDDRDNIVPNSIQVALIVGVITVNTWIGIVQEGSAEEAAEALKNMLSADARVLRDNKEQLIPATDVVPGDVIILGTGDRIPADIRLYEVVNLASLEAALTGESVPIDKTIDAIEVKGNPEQTPLGDRSNMTFSATLIAQGSGRGIAIATGDHTQIGTINALVSTVEEKKTNVLEQIDYISKWLAFFIILAAIATFFVAWRVTGEDPVESLSIALVCAVGMIPEGLEAIVTMTYAWAVSNMAKHNAIIRALPAVETLGSVTVICSDKTGTLTQNKMSLIAFVTSNARYRVDVNSKDRVNTNFVRDDNYLAERAQHQQGKNIEDVIASGPNTNRARRGKAAASNHMAITSLHEPSSHSAADLIEESDDPVANGDSPSLEFIRAALSGGVLCSKCVLGVDGGREGEIGNPTEISILRAAYFTGVNIETMKDESPIIAEVPFSSAYKFMATVHNPKMEIDGDIGDKAVVHVKGAPDRMLKLCSHQAKAGNRNESEAINKSYWTEQIAILSSHGLRVLALCRAEIPSSEITEGEQLGPEYVNGRSDPWLTMVGLCAIQDPPRPECIDAIAVAHTAGVRVAMITGDHKDTAIAIGHTLGLVDEEHPSGITGPELDAMDEDELKDAVLKYNIFARASPENKLQIVKALQAQQQVASMTGDGVNDAPSLKQADMGVAMGKEGTDVAREASDMILADDNFATIVAAVREGRVVWDNLRKVLLINTPINNAQGMSVLFGLAAGLQESPLSPIQVLYSNLICAVTLGFVCAIEPPEDGIMDLPPRRVGKRLIGRYLFLRIALGTMVLIGFVVGSVFWARSFKDTDENGMEVNRYTEDQLRSQAFNTLDFGAIAISLSARFAYNSSIHPRILVGNKYCWYSVALVAALQVVITYVPGLNNIIFSMGPMDGIQWGISLLFMVLTFLIMEAEKAVRRSLRQGGADTDDRAPDPLFDANETPVDPHVTVPDGAQKLNLVELKS